MKSEEEWTMSNQVISQVENFIMSVNSALKSTNVQCKINRNAISQSLAEFLEKRRRVAGMTFQCKLPYSSTITHLVVSTTDIVKKKLATI